MAWGSACAWRGAAGWAGGMAGQPAYLQLEPATTKRTPWLGISQRQQGQTNCSSVEWADREGGRPLPSPRTAAETCDLPGLGLAGGAEAKTPASSLFQFKAGRFLESQLPASSIRHCETAQWGIPKFSDPGSWLTWLSLPTCQGRGGRAGEAFPLEGEAERGRDRLQTCLMWLPPGVGIGPRQARIQATKA